MIQHYTCKKLNDCFFAFSEHKNYRRNLLSPKTDNCIMVKDRGYCNECQYFANVPCTNCTCCALLSQRSNTPTRRYKPISDFQMLQKVLNFISHPQNRHHRQLTNYVSDMQQHGCHIILADLRTLTMPGCTA